jgi:hypothetical protein
MMDEYDKWRPSYTVGLYFQNFEKHNYKFQKNEKNDVCYKSATS